jgi:rhodanese-related sulfurtransferase
MGLRIARVLVIVAAGSALGLLWNGFSGRGLALSGNVFIKEGDELIEAAEAKKKLDAGAALFLDARPVAFWEMAHIPGALPLPEDDFDKSFAKLETTLRSHFDIVVYCSGFGCEASHIVAHKLKEHGIPAVILHEGWPAWQEAGYPEQHGARP